MGSSLRRDAGVCAATLRQGSRSFDAASRLLPPRARRHAAALYGFCRVADDLIDTAAPESVAYVVDDLRRRLDWACAGRPEDDPIDRAFAEALAACAIPRQLPEALLEGFAWDAQGRRYADLPALRDYAARVAGAVGAMMALVLGVRDPAALARACDLGVAMQLSNIARDIAEDARAGRLYLPLDWLDEAGIDAAAFVKGPAHSQALAGVVARLLAEAERLYARGEAGIGMLPAVCRPAIRAAARLYREIGREVSRRGARAMQARTVVPASRKALLIVGCCVSAGREMLAPALPETAFLVRAVPRPARTSEELRVIWVMELFARLDARDQARSPG